MKVGFTICANNYLAHAKTLIDSFKENNPDVPFYLALLDAPHGSIDYGVINADEIVWIPEILPALINESNDKYRIAELCTVVKPELFLYLVEEGFETVLYLDPDIKVFSGLKEVFDNLKSYDIILTPHICSPTGEIGHPLDKDLMRTGIYNLGFIALNINPETLNFIKWWNKRVQKFGYHDLRSGYFYDQIWLNYAPAFLPKVYILRDLGYNMANWNLHERKIQISSNTYFVNNEQCRLKFYHFSHLKIENLPTLASYNQNYTLENRPDLVDLHVEYKRNLLENGYEEFRKIDFQYGKKEFVKKTFEVNERKISRYKRSWCLLKKSIRILLKGA